MLKNDQTSEILTNYQNIDAKKSSFTNSELWQLL